jgi:hypothetical protein
MRTTQTKKILLLASFALLTATSCKKDRECFCKANRAGDQDFSYSYKNTKKDAQAACDAENKFWSPEWSCTLK